MPLPPRARILGKALLFRRGQVFGKRRFCGASTTGAGLDRQPRLPRHGEVGQHRIVQEDQCLCHPACPSRNCLSVSTSASASSIVAGPRRNGTSNRTKRIRRSKLGRLSNSAARLRLMASAR